MDYGLWNRRQPSTFYLLANSSASPMQDPQTFSVDTFLTVLQFTFQVLEIPYAQFNLTELRLSVTLLFCQHPEICGWNTSTRALVYHLQRNFKTRCLGSRSLLRCCFSCAF